jgi:hypothetical protein
LYKANFILQLFAKLSFKILVYKGQDNPHTLHTGWYIVSGRNSTKLEQQKPPPLGVYGPELLPKGFYSNFKAFRNGDEIFLNIP